MLSAAGMPPFLSFNTAVSFVTGTNWQAYEGETQASYFADTVGLVVAQFTAAGIGLAVALAVLRGIAACSLFTALLLMAANIRKIRRVSDSLCAGLFTIRFRMLIRNLHLALSGILLPGLFSGFPEPGIPCPAWADTACSYFPGGSGTSAA